MGLGDTGVSCYFQGYQLFEYNESLSQAYYRSRQVAQPSNQVAKSSA